MYFVTLNSVFYNTLQCILLHFTVYSVILYCVFCYAVQCILLYAVQYIMFQYHCIIHNAVTLPLNYLHCYSWFFSYRVILSSLLSAGPSISEHWFSSLSCRISIWSFARTPVLIVIYILLIVYYTLTIIQCIMVSVSADWQSCTG